MPGARGSIPAGRLLVVALLATVSAAGCSLLPAATASPAPSTPQEPTQDSTLGCIDIARDVCEFVAARADETGLSLQPGERVVRRTVRKTAVRMCDGVLQPLYDVTFDVAPAGRVVVTVGKLPDGRLFACTY